MEGPHDPGTLRRIRLRFAGTCAECGRELPKGIEALHDPFAKKIWCFESRGPSRSMHEPVESGPIDPGVAGSSAQREHDRRSAAREARVKERWGNRLGGAVLAVTDDPQTTKAWGQRKG
jgi:hypothetical protein